MDFINLHKKELELEKMSLTFKEIKDFLIKDKTIKDEYRQAAIVLVRSVFSERQTNVEANKQHDSKALHIANVMPRLDNLAPIEDALYATGRFTTDQCSQLADGIIQYIEDAGFNVIRIDNSNEA